MLRGRCGGGDVAVNAHGRCVMVAVSIDSAYLAAGGMNRREHDLRGDEQQCE